jgi:predicted DNA-binding transcriptional regulator YafY
MGRTERLYAIDRLLKQRGALTLNEFISLLEVSRATFRRDLDYLRERLHAPIIWDTAEKKYCFDSVKKFKAYALPGLWFNETEIYALLAMQQLLDDIEPGLLAPHLGPLKKKLYSLIKKGEVEPETVARRIRISPLAKRTSTPTFFEIVASGVLHRKQLRITHYNRHTNKTLTRQISPLRLVYYRDNWYLDSLCHLRDDLRSFAVDAIKSVIATPEGAIDVPLERVRQVFDAGYGMFSGVQRNWAELRFSAYRARWVSNEIWHPDQVGSFDDEGRYLLKIPYNDPRELIGDILRHGAECEVLGPHEFRQMVKQEVGKLSGVYLDAT